MGHPTICVSSGQDRLGESYLAGEDKGDLLWQLNADALHDSVWHRVCAAVLAPSLQLFLCWRAILQHK